MKAIIMILILAGSSGIFANAQNKRDGVYLSLRDYENSKPSYTKNDGYKIHFNEFLKKPFITMNHDGQRSTVFKDEIFAFRHNDNVIRTWNLIPYNLLEQGIILIYYKDQAVSRGKGMKAERKYFYSTADKDEIIPLTILNLKNSFPDKYLFQNFLDAQFKNDSELSLYDEFSKQYKVNQLLKTTVYSKYKN